MTTNGVNIRPFNTGNVRIYADPRTVGSRTVGEYAKYPLTQESTSFVTSGKSSSNATTTSGRLAMNNVNYEQSYPVQIAKRKASLGEVPPTQPKQTCTTFRQPTARKSGVIRIDARDYSESLGVDSPKTVMTLPRAVLPVNNYTGTTTMATQKPATKSGYIQRNPSKTSLYAPASITHSVAMTNPPPVTTSIMLNDIPPPVTYSGVDTSKSSMRRQHSNNSIAHTGYEYVVPAGNGGTMRRSQPTTSSNQESVLYPPAYTDTLLYKTHGKNGIHASNADASGTTEGIKNKTFSNTSISASANESVPLNGQQVGFDASQQENAKNIKKSSSLDHKLSKSDSKTKDVSSYKYHQKPPKDIIAKDKNEGMGRLALCCMCVLVILLVTAIIFVIYFAANYSNLRAELVTAEISDSSTSPPRRPDPTKTKTFKATPKTTTIRTTRPAPDPNKNICLTPECIQAAGIVLRKMNTSVDPCKDFYEYSCGGWISSTYVPPDEIVKYGVVQEIESSNEKLVYEVLMRPDDSDTIPADSGGGGKDKNLTVAERKAKLFFKSCVDMPTINILGRTPMLEMISQMGGWDALGNWNQESWNLDQMLYILQGEHNVNVFFVMRMQATGYNETKNVLRLEADGITIPDPGFYVNDKTSTGMSVVAMAYKRLIRNILTLLGGRNVENFVEDIYNFEKRIATIMSQLNGDEAFLTIQELQEVCPQIKWFTLLQRIFKKQRLTDDTEIIVNSKSYMKNLSSLLINTDPRTVHNYMVWRSVVSTARFLSTPFRRSVEDFSAVLRGPRPEIPLWKQCLSEIRKHFGIAVGALFVRESFSMENKRNVENMVGKIKRSFLINIRNLEWMDDDTKRKARGKINAMPVEVGFPDELFSDIEGLNAEYKFAVGKNTYFKNVRNSIKYKIYQTVDSLFSSRWTSRSALPQAINAFYSPQLNKAFFPAGLLQSPLYNEKFPMAFNFGGIGSTIGHEITHGYDALGQRYDAQGKYRPWWSESTISKYNEKTHCIIDHYSKYSVGENFVNGLVTLPENIADIAGLKVSFAAYKKWAMQNNIQETKKKLPGLDLTHEQLFFVGYSQMWCMKSRHSPEAIRWQFQQSHSPEKFRVLGGISLNAEFAKVFKCKPNSPMIPSKRCSLW